jgi:N-acyl-L-homoserine lactone synthetase
LSGSQRRMAAFTDQLVDPLIADTYGEEVVRMRDNIFSERLVWQVKCQIL